MMQKFMYAFSVLMLAEIHAVTIVNRTGTQMRVTLHFWNNTCAADTFTLENDESSDRLFGGCCLESIGVSIKNGRQDVIFESSEKYKNNPNYGYLNFFGRGATYCGDAGGKYFFRTIEENGYQKVVVTSLAPGVFIKL